MFFGEGGKLILEAISEFLELILELGTQSHFLLFRASLISIPLTQQVIVWS